MTRNPARLSCRIFAASAWIVALAVFALAVVASWGYMPGAMLMWSAVALPLGGLTRRWIRAAGGLEGGRVERRIVRAWQVLGAGLVGAFGIAFVGAWNEALGEQLLWWFYFPLAVPYALFPLLVTGWVLMRIMRVAPSEPAV